jgi:hypothetical protein
MVVLLIFFFSQQIQSNWLLILKLKNSIDKKNQWIKMKKKTPLLSVAHSEYVNNV